MVLDWNESTDMFTPSKEEQSLLVLQGKCPHNQGWSWHSFGHNDSAYTCDLCKKMEFY